MAEQEIQKPKKKKLKKRTAFLIVLLAILAALLTTYALVSMYNAKLDEAKAGADEVTEMLRFNVSDVESFSYLFGDDLVTLERDGDDWIYTGDEDMDVDEDKVDAMLAGISTVTTKQVVASIVDADKLGDYGLKDPSFLISLKFKDGGTKTLCLGIENPMTQAKYARVDQEAVFMVDPSLTDSFSAPELLREQNSSNSSKAADPDEGEDDTGVEGDDDTDTEDEE